MPQIDLVFDSLLVDSHEIGDDDHMASEAHLSISVDGQPHGHSSALIKQTVGAGYEGPVEVTPPVGYEGPFSHHKFSAAVEEYFRLLVGSDGNLRVEPDGAIAIHPPIEMKAGPGGQAFFETTGRGRTRARNLVLVRTHQATFKTEA